jgi:aldehyde dehydrogenase (NAD+)
MTGAQRAILMHKLVDLIEANADELCQWEAIDVGKPITQARGDLAGVVGSWRYYAGWADKITGSVTQNTGDNNIFTYTTKEPVGVCGQIVSLPASFSVLAMWISHGGCGQIPWNFPMMMQAWKLAPVRHSLIRRQPTSMLVSPGLPHQHNLCGG